MSEPERPRSSEVRRVDAAEAKRLRDEEGFVLVDVRTELEFAAGHATGSVNAPATVEGAQGLEDNDELALVLERVFGKAAGLVLVCSVGRRSYRVARSLAALGFHRVVDLRPGLDGTRDPFGRLVEKGWRACGLPMEDEPRGGDWDELRRRAGLDG